MLTISSPTFCPKVLAGLERLPSTVEDRSLRFDFARALPQERPVELTPREERALEQQAGLLRLQLQVFVEEHLQALKEADPELPEIDARGQQIALPLMAIAEQAGDSWPIRARQAITNVRDRMFASRVPSEPEQLLADIRTVFGEREAYHSGPLCEALRELEDRPWRYQNLNPWRLAKRLKNFRIEPQNFRIGGHMARGYRRQQFEDAWRRYLDNEG